MLSNVQSGIPGPEPKHVVPGCRDRLPELGPFEMLLVDMSLESVCTPEELCGRQPGPARSEKQMILRSDMGGEGVIYGGVSREGGGG